MCYVPYDAEGNSIMEFNEYVVTHRYTMFASYLCLENTIAGDLGYVMLRNTIASSSHQLCVQRHCYNPKPTHDFNCYDACSS